MHFYLSNYQVTFINSIFESISGLTGTGFSIFKDIKYLNKTFIEIGSGSGLENNTHYLLLKGWKGVWIDSNKSKVVDRKIASAFLIKSSQNLDKNSKVQSNKSRGSSALV